jgi:hypothetical protein
MIDERARRKATFQEGTAVRLADGQHWTLPGLSGDESDPVLEALVLAVNQPEPGPEQLRDELALTIALLSRNYQLAPELYPTILGFRAGDPARVELQETIRKVARGASPPARARLVPNVDRGPRPSTRWRLFSAPSSRSSSRSK